MRCTVLLFAIVIVVSGTVKASTRNEQLDWSSRVIFPGQTYRPVWTWEIANPDLSQYITPQKPQQIKTTPTPIKATPKLIMEEPYPNLPVWDSGLSSQNYLNTEREPHTPNQIKATPKPIISTPKPIITTPKPIITTPKPIITTPKPITEELYPNMPIWNSDTPVDYLNPGHPAHLFKDKDLAPDGSVFNPGKTTCNLTSSPPLPRSLCCGVDALSNDRVVGGNKTELEHHPWLVQIEYRCNKNNELKRLCGGFLISARYVLSAAHCFAGSITKTYTPISVILGEYNSTNEGRDCVRAQDGVVKCTDGALSVGIQRSRVHPEYLFDGRRNLNDVAIIRLMKPVEYTKYIRPICLPTSDISLAPPADLSFTTAGWGNTYRFIFKDKNGLVTSFPDVKRHVDVPFVKTQKCREQYTFVNSGHICAGGERGKDSCKGDSGGPLMLQKDGVYTAVGIVSTSLPGCGVEGQVAVYTNVYQYLGWIADNITP
ncbi:hypothetical protein O0L34_g8318 [Tuta absoluta]|nr:hypothetical protein O0L34_g8318 [Tuta absoluta]